MAGALEGFRGQGRLAYDRLLDLSDDAMVDELFRDARDSDILWLDDESKRQCAADLRDALQGNYDGLATDNIAFGLDWDIDLTRLAVPTWIWHGEHDRLVPPSHAHWLAARIPHANLVIRPGKAHGGTIFEHWDDMFDTLRERVQAACLGE